MAKRLIEMNYRHIFIFFLLTSCTSKEAPSKWITTENIDEFEPQELNLTKFSINGFPLILSKQELLSNYGQPDTIRFGGGFQPEEHRINHTQSMNTLVEYESYVYPSFSVAVWNNNAQVNFINFQDSDLSIVHPLIKLSNNTHIDEIKTIFQYSYEWRNYPLHRQFGLDPEEMYGFKKDECVWIDFKNGLDDYHWNIELTFLNDYLIWADFAVVEDKARP